MAIHTDRVLIQEGLLLSLRLIKDKDLCLSRWEASKKRSLNREELRPSNTHPFSSQDTAKIFHQQIQVATTLSMVRSTMGTNKIRTTTRVTIRSIGLHLKRLHINSFRILTPNILITVWDLVLTGISILLTLPDLIMAYRL